MPTKIGMVSLGCPKNQVDAEMMMYNLYASGYELSQDPALADVVIINTCGFIESAKQEAIEETMEYISLKQEGRIKKIILTGCLAERYREQIREEMPEVDAVVGIGCNKDIVSIVGDVLHDKKRCLIGNKCDLPLEGKRILSTLPFYAYLKVAEGCDHRCSYCAIPGIRGKFRSRPIEGLIEEAKELAAKGVKEIVIVAQDPTHYGFDLYGKCRLPELLREIAHIDGIVWVRLLYAYPERITEELLDVIAEEPHVAKYLDLPIQHCSKDILRAMYRPGDRESLEKLIAHLRERIPGVILRTTLIAGFPGETEEQFEDLCDFVKKMKFDRLGCFAYSQEEGTPAAELDCQIDEDVKAERARIINEEQMNIMADKTEESIGKEMLCVVEGFDRWGDCFFGRSEADAPDIDGKVFFTAENKLAVGQFVRVKIEDTMDMDLIGVVTDEHPQ